MKSNFGITIRAAGLACILGSAATQASFATEPEDAAEPASKQIAELEHLQSTFHNAASGAGATDEANKLKHVNEMLAIFTEDGTLIVKGVVYSGRGEPGTSTCVSGSLTLCDFFTNISGAFKIGNNWVGLTPSFLNSYEPHGKYAYVYFECHYIDVPTGVKKADASFGIKGIPNSGQARKVRGKWLLSFAEVGAPGLSTN